MLEFEPGSHSPWKAFIFSLICFYGGGQMYNRQYFKVLIAWVIAGLAIPIHVALMPLLLIPVIDAVIVARRLNRGERVSEFRWF